MTRPCLPLAILATAGLALFLSACGVDGGEQATTASDGGSSVTSTTAAPSRDLTEQEQAAIDITVETYMDLGMSEKDATCLAEGIVGTGGGFDNGDIMDVVNECDITMETLQDLGSIAGGSMEDGMKLGLKTSLENAGLAEKDASCVADAYVDEFGTDVTAAQDPDKLAPLLKGCDVSPSELTFN